MEWTNVIEFRHTLAAQLRPGREWSSAPGTPPCIHVFSFHLPSRQLPDALCPSHRRRNFICIASSPLAMCPSEAFLVFMSFPWVLQKQRLCHIHSLALQAGRESSTATLWMGGCRSQHGPQSEHEVALVGWGWEQRESPWAGGTGRAATHLVSVKKLCEDADCCVQDDCCGLFWVFFCFFPISVLEQILLYSGRSSDNRFCP